MANFQAGKTKWLSPKKRAWIAISILFCISFVLGKAAFNIYKKNELAQRNKESTFRELAELKERKESIEVKLANIKSPEGLEKEIRKNLPVAKEGEYVINIVDEDATSTARPVEPVSTTTIKKTGFWGTFLRGL